MADPSRPRPFFALSLILPMASPRRPNSFDSFDDNGGRSGNGSGGGFTGALKRVFSGGAHFFDWALPLYTAWGIRVRIHLLFILFAIGGLFVAATQGRLLSASIGTAGLFVIVLLHEYGHCIACRKVGGEADDILMWPLGGLAFCRPPHNWRAELLTVVWGPMVNVMLIPVFGAAVMLLGGSASSLLFNPFNPFDSLIASGLGGVAWKSAIWWLYYSNISVLAFNVILPMYPLDGGRMWQCILWRKIGWRRSTMVAANVGIVCAILMFILGVFSAQGVLMGIALMSGLTCYQQRLAILNGDGGEEESPFAESLAWRPGRQSGPAPRGGRDLDASEAAIAREAKAKAQAKVDSDELDRILAKIAKEGMAALSRKEKAFLTRETQKKRVQ